MTGTTFIGATVWPYMEASGAAVVVLPEAEGPLRAAGWVRRTELDPLRIQLAHTTAPVVPDTGDETA
jgi:hypothetical protein